MVVAEYIDRQHETGPETGLLRIGVIGGGGIAGAHLMHLRAMEDVKLIGVADINPSNAQATAEQYDLEFHTTDWRELLPSVDAVLICVPTHVHAEIAVEALRAGKHVFCEKPIARTLEQADAMLAAARESGAALQIGFVRHFDETWQKLEESITAGEIGRPVVWRDVMAGPGPGPLWFHEDDKGGGPIMDGAIHTIDFALETFGEAEWVFAHMRTLRGSSTALDTGTVTIRFRSGDELLLAWSWGLPQGCSGARVFELLGPEGTLTWPQDESGEAGLQRFTVTHSTKEPTSVSVNADETLVDGYKGQMEEFISVARGEKAPTVGGTQGREALRVVLAVFESARSQQVIQL